MFVIHQFDLDSPRVGWGGEPSVEIFRSENRVEALTKWNSLKKWRAAEFKMIGGHKIYTGTCFKIFEE